MAEIRGLTIAIGADTSKFNRDIKNVEKEVSQTSKRIDTITSSLKLEWNPDKFAQAQQEARKAIELTEMKASKLKEQLKLMEDSGSKDNQFMSKLRTDIERTELTALQLKKKLDEIQNLKFEHIGKQFETVGNSISNVGQKLAPVSAAALALLGSFTAIASSAVKFGDTIGTTAQQLNISSEALQKWNYIAAQTDVGEAEMVNGINKIQVALGELSTGTTSKASESLAKLGISSSQASKGMGENFELIIQRLSNVADATEQAAIANELFGAKLGSKLIPMLNNGGQGLEALSAEFESLGYLTNEQIDDLDAFEDAIDKLKYQFTLLKNEIGVALLPLMKQLASFVQDSILPALRKLTDWFSSLSNEQQKTIFGILGIVAAMAPALMIIGKVMTGVGGLIKQLGALSKVFSVIAAHPIILVIVALIALIAHLYRTNEEFKQSIDELISTLSNALKPVIDTIVVTFQNLLKTIIPVINTLVQSLAPILTVIIRIITRIIEAITPLINIFLKQFALQFEIIGKVVTILAKVLQTVLVPVFEFLAGFVEKVFDRVINAIQNVINVVIGFVNGVISVLNVVGNLLGFTISKLEELDGTTIETVNRVVDETEEQEAVTPTSALKSSSNALSPSSVTNYDYSNKNIQVSVVVENFAQNVDVDDLVRQLNIKLAEAF